MKRIWLWIIVALTIFGVPKPSGDGGTWAQESQESIDQSFRTAQYQFLTTER